MSARRVLLGVSRKLYHGIRHELEIAGYRVAMAKSFEEFLQMARGSRFDYLVIDQNCDETPGIELVKVLSLDETLRDIPRTLLTRRAGEEPQKVVETAVSTVQWHFDAPRYCRR